ncbi:hypothetical protein A374_16328 [Fictibacillus macauensis ZFHKF-1]|uniref:Uncharacterized protein n=1 Tax=Fictibacillus macauensis ZFHKF-1 TaxID=1196324 RepID=I8UBP7_9BACL|nr:hypothetical protein [Fictibacillus macauensis]EIT84370.1 hypothetical protein A374_16328 [Fictibacillus macauensis ZFHKF-1]
MKKRTRLLLLSATLLTGVALFLLITLVRYEPARQLSSFPIPKSAKVLQTLPHGYESEWASASEENGIPWSYQLVLKMKGWHEGERMGASTIYTKGTQKVDIVSTTERLDIQLVE